MTVPVTREPLTVVELEQPRCGLRFGVGACTASGTPKCFNTYTTCGDKENFAPGGGIRWRFVAPDAGPVVLYERAEVPFGSQLIPNNETPQADWATQFSGTTKAAEAGTFLGRFSDATRVSSTQFGGHVRSPDFDLPAGAFRLVMWFVEGTSGLLAFRVRTAAGSTYRWLQLSTGVWTTDTNDSGVTQSDLVAEALGGGVWRVGVTLNFATSQTGVFIGAGPWSTTGGNVVVLGGDLFQLADNIGTNPIYCLRSVSSNPSRINLGASRKGESPFGTRGGVTVQLSEVESDDHVGDYYRADRTVRAGFWALWRARNQDPFRGVMFLRVYEGYRGQALADMQVRSYVFRDISGPDANGAVTIRGDDPLQLADKRRAQFPRSTDLRLVGDLTAGAAVVRVFGALADLSADFGNTGARRFMTVGREILEYTGWTDEGDGQYLLTGVRRGQLGTTAREHKDGDGCQRAGRYEDIRMWQVLEDLLKAHTQIPDEYINPGDAWLSERPWLRAQTSATIATPEDVEKLAGELCRDGGFAVWWDERTQTIPLLSLRPPQGAIPLLTDDSNALAGSARLKEDTDARITRVAVFYQQQDPTERLDDEANYRVRRIRVDGEVEGPASDGTIRERAIFSRWIRTDANAFLIAAQQLQRYRVAPQYLSLALDAKDRALSTGGVVEIESRTVIDTEGTPERRRWQIISAEEVDHGHTLQIEAQAFGFDAARFAVIMANSTLDYESTSEADREPGCWLADETTGLMPNGDDPYLLQ